MKELNSCKEAMASSIENKYFSIAHLYKDEKAMEMHIHDCYEVYFSISGGKQFLIDNKVYDIAPGDLFLINQYDSHYLTQIEKEKHERIVIMIDPDYMKEISSKETNLDACFQERNDKFSHKISLTSEQQSRFLYFVNKILTSNGYGHDLLERATFTELFVLINQIVNEKNSDKVEDRPSTYNEQVDAILSYLNNNIQYPISIGDLSKQFYISESYICRIFKSATGTTINKYMTARRISIAKSLLAEGIGVSDVCEKCGFSDYSNFLKAFTKSVGISPKKYSQNCNR
ncbi:AraC-type DNA-binding protein [Butyrivibrio sp. Su6]|jgi:AraC-like DNA-binding protein/mannose-6-phosphate isomerase-like protein (cupin superfamily)|uniref:AraC family transcriptional regulator n=1 Tax=Butyrivibrio sp. Su6 TaxID=1520810 RepID=UPI00089F8386|nr:helix-turn-helix domain-containing protein [Butyrivibrio sp. Su6]SEF50504.1 AraC-type DNA-binding protein [Butyrivibrio sp. Su6]